jgi:predicted ATP-binding protein involved in virulence
MHLKRLQLENLGPVRSITLNLQPRFNVIAGINGAGKTTILTAFSIMLSRYSAAVRTGRATGTLSREGIRKGARYARASIIATDGIEDITWTAGVARPGRKITPLTQSRELIAYATGLADAIEQNPDKADLPIVASYSVNRAVLDIPLRIRTKVPFAQYAALDDSLLSGPRNFRTFFAWFRDREDVENELRAEGSRARDPQLTAVRRAVEGLLDGFKNLRVKRQPLRMLITKDEVDFQVDQLSDGEKCVLALVGDLARRLAIANPGKRNPLTGDGIILIDELELHLHPAWQRSIVGRLQKVFPNCQFIVTTHSAQVLGEVDPEAVFLLDHGQIRMPSRSFGRDSNLILAELMGASPRSKWATESLEQLYELIDDEEMDEAREHFLELERRLGTEDPSLTAARALLISSDRAA